jgi:hypothetical protein
MIEYIRACQSTPNRMPTCCPEDGAKLFPEVMEDIWDGTLLLLTCPECGASRELTDRELIGFRVFGELLKNLTPPGQHPL